MPLPPPRLPYDWSSQNRAELAFSDALRLKITLLGANPPVWRRLQLPIGFTLRSVHTVIQAAMGWKDRHGHRFQVGERVYGISGADAEELKDSRWITLQDVLTQGVQDFTYQYDVPGPSVHQLRIESVTRGDATNQHPVCLDGEGASPPEGGGSLVDFEGHASAGPGAFNVRAANARLATLR
jgi:Plasmid pRiA4b ORF-3-like protein